MKYASLVRTLASVALCLVQCSHLSAQALDPAGRFLEVSEGTLDTQTGLVWGFSLSRTGNGAHNWQDVNNLVLPNAVYDGITYSNYNDWSNARSGESHFDWRIPSTAELKAAAQASLFIYHDVEPGPDFWNDLGTGFLWSNSKRGNKGYVVDANTPPYDTFLLSLGTSLDAIPVRSIAPPPSGGGGKGKNK
ncbi:MAG: hypothetical protein R3C56_19320 [Pirellulaceae bacterium]